MNKTQKRWKKGLVGFGLASLLTVSGCSNILRDAFVTKEIPVDMSKSIFVENYKNKADEIMGAAKTKGTARAMDDVRIAVELYEQIKDYDNMINAARFYFDYDPKIGNMLLQSCQEKLNEAKKK